MVEACNQKEMRAEEPWVCVGEEKLGELAEELGVDESEDLAGIRSAAAQEDPLSTDQLGN